MTAATRVTELPDDCLACVLSFLPPALIARCAFVCSAWRAAAAPPVAWMRVLPALCQHACFTALPLASRHPHPRAWCRELCGGVLLHGGVFHARMDPNTAKLTVSASALVALPFPLRCGVYDVAWRVARDPTHDEYARAAGAQPRRVGLLDAGGDESEEDDEESEEEDEDGEVELEGGRGGVQDGEQAPGLGRTPEAANVSQAGVGGGGAANPFQHMVGAVRRLIWREPGVQARRSENQGQHSSEQQVDWERRREAWRRVEKRCWFKWVGHPAWSNVREEGCAGGGGGEQRQLRISTATIAMLPDWTTLPAGRVTIRGATARETAVAPTLSMRLWETESGWWKDGLYLDALQLTET
ncbi:unnamed protein product [Closterium sp. Naga37s-1]|nr:unnamed protein product [Closterium sp. Naga37s-1]